MATYITGTRQHIGVHDDHDCIGRYCVIHKPSAHVMVNFPTHWRADRGLMERICPHGVGHPDPDHLDFVPAGRRQVESIHGCCPEHCCFEQEDKDAANKRDERESNP